MRGGSAPWAVAALAAAVLAGCGQVPVTNPLPDPVPARAAAVLRSFRFPSCANPALPEDCDARIHGAEVDAVIPFGTGRGCLVAEFEADAEKVLVGDREQVSGETSNDYSQPLVYTLVGGDGVTREYAVHVAGWWTDDFDREDSPVVGNGWTEIEPGTPDKAEASLINGTLVMDGADKDTSSRATVLRDFPAPLPRPFRVETRFSRDMGGVLCIQVSDSAGTESRSFEINYNSLVIWRNGATELAGRDIVFQYTGTYTLVCSVDAGSLSVSLVDDTGDTQALACPDPVSTTAFTRITISGGRYFGGCNCRTLIERVEFSSPCCP